MTNADSSDFQTCDGPNCDDEVFIHHATTHPAYKAYFCGLGCRSSYLNKMQEWQ